MKKSIFLGVLALALLLSPQMAQAATPYLTVSAQSGSNYQITVNSGNSYASVNLYTREAGTDLWTVFHNLGQTNSNGYFSTNLLIGSFKSSIVRESYVTVGGISSSIVSTGSSGGSLGGSLSFSPASVSVNQNASATVSVYNNPVNQNLYIASNSNSSVVSASASGTNSVSVYGISQGYATIQVCSGSGNYCGSFSVTVNGNIVGNISFSPASPNLSVGQNLTVSINTPYFYSGSYYVSQNSNSGAVSASVSGSTLNLYGLSSGNSTLTICQTGGGSACGTLYVYVYTGQASGLTYNPSTVSLNIGANSGVYVSGTGGQNLFVSSNSNPQVASVGINNQNSITVYGINTGSTTIRLCTYNTQVCGNLPVYVYSGSSSQGSLSFVTSSLPAGSVGSNYQSQILVSGGNSPYTYQVTSGTLPAGLSLNTSGVLSGTPTTRSQFFFTVRATDNYSRQGSQAFNVEIFSGSVLGSYTFQNGLIVQSGSTVYIVYKNTKTAFSSRGAFEGLGFRFSQISCTNCGYLADSGHVVSTAARPHPWGSWVKSGSTIFFVHESGLIPISSYDVFVNNGGQDYLVVPLNGYDAGLPRLSVMTYNDARLR